MPASASHQTHTHAAAAGRLWWLPARGVGNGLDDDTGWAPLAEVSVEAAAALLSEFASAGVPGYAAPAGGLLSERCHVFVGASAYGRAEEIIRTALPRLLRRAAS